ncbi:MAG: hypothetical protein FD177_378 [Desulfovibrionaceae bacterium]|nr:MAG: hypothetical protein FD177_378 [Desulfovibrionaceae bacterium]
MDIDVTPLIVPATAAFAYVIDKASGAVVGKVAVEAATKLWTKVKSRFTSPAALEAVAELEAAPADEDAREAFQVQLKKVLKNDHELAQEISAMLQQFGDSAFMGNTQQAKAKNGSTVIQVVGGGNKISGI